MPGKRIPAPRRSRRCPAGLWLRRVLAVVAVCQTRRVRVLVTGAAGQLGTDICRLAEVDKRVMAVAGLTRAELDITDAARVRAVIRDQARPANVQGGLVVLNTAAWTDVDGAEADEAGAYA